MSGRASGFCVEKMERTFAFRPPQPHFRKLYWSASLSATVVIFVSTFALASAEDAGEKWSQAAFVLCWSFVLLLNTAEALYAGAFGGRFVEQARRLRAVIYFFTWPAAVVFCVAAGYYLAEMTGALAGGMVGIVFSSACLFYDSRRGRARAGEAVRSRRH